MLDKVKALELLPDGVHITAAGVDNLIEPALNQIIANVAGAVYGGDA